MVKYMDTNNLLAESNYNNTLEDDAENIVNEYFNIVKEYLFHAGENIIISNYTYYIFIIKRGLDCLKHIFNMLLLYTNNLELVVYHCKKSYLYYIEFISQIGNENHSYLQLNSKDAALFIYKKTIFDINNNKRISLQQTKNNKNKLDYAYICSEIINEIIIFVFDNDNIKTELKMNYIMYIINMTTKVKDKIIKSKKTVSEKIKLCKILNYFLNNLKIKAIKDECKYLNICNLISKKILQDKKNISIESIDSKLSDKDFDEKLVNNTPLKFVNWLINT